MIPNELAILFGDTNLSEFDPSAYPDYTTFRVLEYGDVAAFEWLRNKFSDEEIRRVLRTERRLSPKSATFWALVYRIDAREVAALHEAQTPLIAAHEYRSPRGSTRASGNDHASHGEDIRALRDRRAPGGAYLAGPYYGDSFSRQRARRNAVNLTAF